MSEEDVIDMIPLDLRNRSVGRRGTRTPRGARAVSPPPAATRRARASTPKTTRTAIPRKEVVVEQAAAPMVLDVKALAILLVCVVIIFFVLLSLFAPAAGAGSSDKVIDVTRSELMLLLEKHQIELQTFLKEARGKLEQQSDAVKRSLPDEIAPVVKQQLGAVKQSLEALVKEEEKRVLAEQKKAIAALKEQLAAEMTPLIAAQLREAEARLAATVELQAKQIEQRVVSSLPAAASPDLRKKDYGQRIVAADTSPTHGDFGSLAKVGIRVLGITASSPPGPETVLEPFVENRCWAFAGSSGTVSIGLREAVRVGSVSLRMTRKTLSFVASHAPKAFQVLGHDERGKAHVLGEGVYDVDGPERQYFAVTSNQKSTSVTIKVLSNHGAKDFTCIQKIGVHAD